MPELPEVETTRLGLLPLVQGKRIAKVTVRDARLRWPIPPDFSRQLKGRIVRDLSRRGKYLLWDCESGFILSHLGMSGSLRVLPAAAPPVEASFGGRWHPSSIFSAKPLQWAASSWT